MDFQKLVPPLSGMMTELQTNEDYAVNVFVYFLRETPEAVRQEIENKCGDGFYVVHAKVNLSSASSVEIKVRKNSTVIDKASGSANNTTLTTYVEAVAGDYFDVYVDSGPQAVGGSENTSFTMAKLW